MKTCTCCKETKPLTDFSPRKHSKQGRSAQCHMCRRAKARLAPSGTKERVRAYGQKARAKNPEQHRLTNRKSYSKHIEKRRQEKRTMRENFSPEEREAFLARRRELRLANPIALKRSQAINKAWHAAHRQRSRQLATQWAQVNPDKVHNRRVQRRARILGTTTIESVDRQAIIARDNSICHICKKPVKPKDLTLDHLIPLARGGSHTALNLAVAHRRCNSSHGARRIPVQLRLLG